MGYAVFHKGELIDWRIKAFRDKWSKKKQKKILQAFAHVLNTYPIQTVISKEPHPTYCTKEVYQLINEIKAITKKKGVSFIPYSLEKLDLSKNSSQKVGVINLTLEKYPHLKRHCETERQTRAEYYIKMFEAIALIDGYYRNQG
ncbi:MAG: hypothetical protein R2800_03365 [Flavipsychrobacter sp.]